METYNLTWKRSSKVCSKCNEPTIIVRDWTIKFRVKGELKQQKGYKKRCQTCGFEEVKVKRKVRSNG